MIPETEKQKQKLWAKVGIFFTVMFTLICVTGLVQSVLLISLSTQSQPGAWRNLIICVVGLIASLVAFIFFALAFRRVTQNPLMYTNRKSKE